MLRSNDYQVVKRIFQEKKRITCSLSATDSDITSELYVMEVFLNNLQSLPSVLQPVFENQACYFYNGARS